MEAAFVLLRIQLEIVRQDYNVKRIREYQMLRENVYEQVRFEFKHLIKSSEVECIKFL